YFGPQPTKDAPRGDSFIEYRRVHLIPANGPVTLEAGEPLPTMYRVRPGDPWQYARETDSALVRTRTRSSQGGGGLDYSFEKFLFYRGLGTFDQALEARSSGPNDRLTLALRNHDANNLAGIFAVWVDRGTIRFGKL